MSDGDQSREALMDLQGELGELLCSLPDASLGYPLTDPATCLQLREAVQALQRAVDLVGQAVEREDPRYNAVADLIEEAQAVTAN